MAEAAEARVQAPETISRRTDDILFNVRHLACHILSKEIGTFDPEAENDILEQNITDIAESDVHKLGPIVEQRKDEGLGQYVSLGSGTVDNARKGCEALDLTDEGSWFEFYRRAEEIIEEENILLPEMQAEMRAGAVKVMVSPSPTTQEADPDTALSFDYDDRTMLRFQWLSADGKTKYMQSFSIFGVRAEAWASFLSAQDGTSIEPTALAVIQYCNQAQLRKNTVTEILREFIMGVADYVDGVTCDNLVDQLEGFVHEQEELRQQALYYAHEKTAFQKELALSLGGYARPRILNTIRDAHDRLNSLDKTLVSQRFHGSELYVDDYVAELAVKIKTLTTANRAGLATLNERTVMRVASRIGLEAALDLAVREQVIQQAQSDMDEFMVRRSEQVIAESGVGCGGGCSVSVVDLFSPAAKTAHEAGLSGTLYSSPELDKNSKCDCKSKGRKAKVISDGKNVVCLNCKTFQVSGKRGTLNNKAA